MWNENERYCESVAQTNKLWCSECSKRIKKGEDVVFLLDTSEPTETMKDVFCNECKENYTFEVIVDSESPHSEEAVQGY